MSKTQYPWEQLEVEYIQSPEVASISDFLSKRGITYHGHAQLKSNGWKTRRLKTQSEIADLALEEYKRTKAVEVVHTKSDLIEMSERLFEMIQSKLVEDLFPEELNSLISAYCKLVRIRNTLLK